MSPELEVITMMYVLMGLVSAAFLAAATVSVYGCDGLLGNPWVDYVFWWLIGTGVLLALVENVGRARSRHSRWQGPDLDVGQAATSQ